MKRSRHSRSESGAHSRKIRAILRVIAFDIYGTLIDLDGMASHLEEVFGAQAKEAALLWRGKQIEFSFRRGLMQKYVSFDVCTAQALTYVSEHIGVPLGENVRRALLDAYLHLPAYPDVKPAFESLTNAGYTLMAATNGTERSVRVLLRHAELFRYFQTIFSVDSIQTFKPNPAVYEQLVHAANTSKKEIWFVSGNPWDVIGAKACGLKSVWLRRDAARIFDPWEFSPDLIVTSLEMLCDELARQE
jgi:2-haloacid dehalogenase